MSEENESSKWLIDRTEHLLQAHQMGLQSNKEKLEKFTHDYISNLLNWRNGILAATAFCVTLIFGLQQTRYYYSALNEGGLLLFLIVVLLIGGVSCLIMSLYIRNRTGKFWEIEKTYLSGDTA